MGGGEVLKGAGGDVARWAGQCGRGRKERLQGRRGSVRRGGEAAREAGTVQEGGGGRLLGEKWGRLQGR